MHAKATCAILLGLIAGCASVPSGRATASSSPPVGPLWTEATLRAATVELADDFLRYAERMERGNLKLVATVMPMRADDALLSSLPTRFADRLAASGRVRVADRANIVVVGEHYTLDRASIRHRAVVMRAVDASTDELLWVGIHEVQRGGQGAGAASSVGGAELSRVAGAWGPSLAGAVLGEGDDHVIKLRGVVDSADGSAPVGYFAALIERALFRRLGRDRRHQLLAGTGAEAARSARRRSPAAEGFEPEPEDANLEPTARLSAALRGARSAGGGRYELSLQLVAIEGRRTIWARRALVGAP